MELKYIDKEDVTWQQRVEQIGFGYHTFDDKRYWVDNYYFSITPTLADKIYEVTEELWDLCLKAVEYVIVNKKYDDLKIPKFMQHHIERTWEQESPSVYGRFDLAIDEKNGLIKLLEFNADTPTSLFECGVVQWHWKEHYFGDKVDQFNSVHEQLIETWKEIKPFLKGPLLHFTCVRASLEDLTTVEYLRDCAIQAGIETSLLFIDEIGWDGETFIDMEDNIITDIFKLYPWEWMVNESFAVNIVNDINEAQWIEPSWKMILSNKGLLAILWKLNPYHPLLLETYLDTPLMMKDYVKKPLLSREGANISMFKDRQVVESTTGEYGHEGYVYQALAPINKSEKGYFIVGSWIVGETACGLTFREGDQMITTDKSRFVPHIIEA